MRPPSQPRPPTHNPFTSRHSLPTPSYSIPPSYSPQPRPRPFKLHTVRLDSSHTIHSPRGMKRTRSPLPQRQLSLASVEPLDLEQLASSLDLSEDTRASVLSLIEAWDDEVLKFRGGENVEKREPRMQVLQSNSKSQSQRGQPCEGELQQTCAKGNEEGGAPMLWRNLCKLWEGFLNQGDGEAADKRESHQQVPVEKPIREEEAREEVDQMDAAGEDAEVSEVFEVEMDEKDVGIACGGLPDVVGLMDASDGDVDDDMEWMRWVDAPAQRRCITRDAIVDRHLADRRAMSIGMRGRVWGRWERHSWHDEDERAWRKMLMVEERRRVMRSMRVEMMGNVPRNTKLPRRAPSRKPDAWRRGSSGVESPTDIRRWR